MHKLIDIGIVCVLALCVVAFPVEAHDHGQVDKYKSAKNKTGVVCCDGTDHDPVLDWRRTDKGFRVQLMGGVWVDAPANVEVPNVHGVWEARVWLWHDDHGGKHIRCFLAGVEI
jgi:hypothetical protein